MTTIVSKRLADVSFVEVLPDGTTRALPDRMNWSVVDALTDEEVLEAANSDPDAHPLPEEALKAARRGLHARMVRKRLRVSLHEFAERYHFPRGELAKWESHQSEPGAMAKAHLKAIAADPEGVASAVAANPQAAE